MPNTRLCLVCAALTALFALLLLVAPSPGIAQDEEHATTVSFGDGEALIGTVVTKLKMIGSDQPLVDFKLLVLVKKDDGASVNLTGFTDAKGQMRIELKSMPAELRVFAFGDYSIPEGWSNIPLGKLNLGDTPSEWEVEVRPLLKVKVSGQITIDGMDVSPELANVAFAPLDVDQDGNARMFDEPRAVRTDEDGRYEIELPSGYYKVWSYWADRSVDDWPGFIKVTEQQGIFKDTTIDLKLIKGPMLEGRVIDGRTGEGVAASINLYTNQYLIQLRVFTADGEFPNETGPDGEEIIWPIGTFKKQIHMVDPNDFTVVIRPAGSDQVLRVIDNLKAADIVGKKITWELYTDDMPVLDVRVSTQDHPLPVNNLDVTLRPLKIEVPEHLSASYKASGVTEDDGAVRFMGLAKGTYEVYAERTIYLGNIDVSGAEHEVIDVDFKIPFAWGKVKLPDGELCKNLEVFVWLTNKAGQEFGPYPSSAFKDNPNLKEKGEVFVPLLAFGSTFRFAFAAMEGGKPFENSDWVKISDFPLKTEDTVITVDDEKAWELDLTLKANPDYKPKEEEPEEDPEKEPEGE